MVPQIQNTHNIEIKNMKFIQIGTWLEFIIDLITLSKGELIALWIAKKLFNKDTCGCCERKQWLNRLTNKDYDGKCNQIKL
jgi:hypothetical protein